MSLCLFILGCAPETTIYPTVVSSPSPVPVSSPSPYPVVSPSPVVEQIKNISCEVYDLSSYSFNSIPDFDTLTRLTVLDIGTFDAPQATIAHPFQLFPATLAAQLPGAWGLSCTSYLNIPENGNYSFELFSDDGSRLYMDGAVLINNDGPHAFQGAISSVNLLTGLHKIRMEVWQNNAGQQGLQLQWLTPSVLSFDVIPADAFVKE